MKSIISLALILLISPMSVASESQSETSRSVTKRELGTSFKFSGSSLRGKYSGSMGTAATVENDKLLDDLLRGRTEFKDRLAKETERN